MSLYKIFPYKIHLNIFQIEHYYIGPFFKWIISHFFKRELEGKIKLVWTFKARLLLLIAITYSVLDILILFYFLSYIGLIIGLIMATQTWFYLILAQLTLLPLERYKTNKIKKNTTAKLLRLKKQGLQIIGITGSAGKTSTKQFLYHILKSKYKILRTPESYNTVLGIAKVVDLELDESYDFFIVEMGAYQIGDIKEICDMVLPDHGILTNIGEQHLERFGSLENTTKTKFELIDSVAKSKNSDIKHYSLVNIDNEYIKKNYKTHDSGSTLYGREAKNFTINDPQYSEQGTEFKLVLNDEEFKASTPILGDHNLLNILAASTLAYLLNVEEKSIIKSLKTLKAPAHRLEFKKLDENNLLIDNAFNSNVAGFKEDLKVLSQFKDRKKIIVTPGVIELGDKTKQIHIDLGQRIDKACDFAFLVGKSDRTKALEEGINNKDKIKYLDTVAIWFEEVKKLGYEKTIILLENDLPDNY